MVPKILELAQLAQRNRMAKMDIGGSGVDSQFDIELFAPFQLFKQKALRHHLVSAGLDDMQLFFRCKHRSLP